jgi:uncharacterized cofD-like protein
MVADDVPHVVALGGGHGLHATLSALRQLRCSITAVVTVADDGGSSGRIRRELPVLPPGDLRMALAALASDPATASALGAGREGPDWAQLLQHRLGGSGALAGHPVGNLLLTGLFDLCADPVQALDMLGGIVGSRGRVLPMCPVPLGLRATVRSVDPDDPWRERVIRGQSSIAATPGRVSAIELVPPDAPGCPQAIEAIMSADTVLLGPGSWFTSVIPHLLVRDLAAAITATRGRVVVVLNLEPQFGETDDFSPEDHLSVLREYCPDLRVDAVVADADSVRAEDSLRRYVSTMGARLIVASLAADSGVARHDPVRLGRVLADAAELSVADDRSDSSDISAEQGVR